jgi:hypothetical protein
MSPVPSVPLATRAIADTRAQSLLEAAMVLPLLCLIIFGVTEIGVALRDQHTISRLSREGSNLISRDVPLEDAAEALGEMSAGPVDFDVNSKVILSVIKRGGTVGTANYDALVLYQRYEFGTIAASSRLTTRGTGSFGTGPDHVADDSDTDTALQLTNAPDDLVSVIGGLAYVTEIITSHPLFTPLARLGVQVPQQLYSIAYF